MQCYGSGFIGSGSSILSESGSGGLVIKNRHKNTAEKKLSILDQKFKLLIPGPKESKLQPSKENTQHIINEVFKFFGFFLPSCFRIRIFIYNTSIMYRYLFCDMIENSEKTLLFRFLRYRYIINCLPALFC
jgi:hypothetical protein